MIAEIMSEAMRFFASLALEKGPDESHPPKIENREELGQEDLQGRGFSSQLHIGLS